MTWLTAEERESYWYGAVGCELCPCGKNLELHKINYRQVNTGWLAWLQTDHEVEDPASQQPTRTAISACYTYLTDFLSITSYSASGLGHVISRHTVRRPLRQHDIGAYRPFKGMTLMQQPLRSLRWARQFQLWQPFHRNWQHVFFCDESRFQLFRADGRTCKRENSSVLCCTVWWWICDGLGRYLWPTSDRPYCHWRKSYRTPLLAHGGHARYWTMFSVVKFIHLFLNEWSYMKSHISPLVNCDIIIWWILLSILVFIYRQIIILSKYNICINLYFVLFSILLIK